MMNTKAKTFFVVGVLVMLVILASTSIWAQGVTTAAMNGKVTDKAGQGLPGANVVATHTPSGTTYGVSTREDGNFSLSNLRVGGPYSLSVSYVGYKKQELSDISLQLSQTAKFDFQLVEEAVQAAEVVVSGERSAVLNASRTGAATSVSRRTIESFPTISRRIEDLARLTPQYSSNGFGFSFAGQDNRMNNVTVDGSYFNNSFGLAGQPGDRTGVAPISLDAIEQLQVNIAPYDVRQGNFVGAGVNTVTKSGTNQISGSVYYQYRHQGLVGTKAGDVDFNPGTFKYNQIGFRIGGPIIENKLFFFTSYESDEIKQPGTTFLANTGGQTVVGNTTRVLATDLDALSSYLNTNFGYQTGPYQGYDFSTPAKRFLAKFDYNMDESNKISLRYTRLDSDTDVLLSNSSSLGAGTRRSNNNGLNFAGSNYKILENIRSIVGEWSSILANNMSNNFIIGYTNNDESRGDIGKLFPLVDIRSAAGAAVYTSFGSEPFTPNNELRYNSFQVQDNFSIYGAGHNLTFGVSAERYESENVFFPGKQSVYVYNSLADFYTDANGYLANPNRTSSPVILNTFQVRWTNIPGQEKPIQPLKVFFGGVYAQDEWQVSSDLRVTIGLRLDVPFFGETGFKNTNADSLSFLDEGGKSVQYSSAKLPDPNILFSPRVGFNWDVMGDRTTQVRGGTGIFTGRPAYVWISNQIGNTGVLTGFESRSNIAAGTLIANGGRPFNPNPDAYKPTSVTGAPASAYELALTNPDFKFPQLWRTNLAVDQELPLGLVGTAEFLYSRDVNGMYYINANLKPADSRFVGADNRLRWTSTANAVTRINAAVANATVLKNQNVGYSWNITGALERPFNDGLYAKFAYNYGEAKNTVDPGSIAAGSWTSNAQANDPNNPGVGFAATSPGHRIFAAISYRQEYFDFGGTTISLFWEGRTLGNASYTFSVDMNNDGATNDLIYVPKDQSEMNFAAIGGTVPFTAQQQADAWEAFIQQDKYLSTRRGQYAERNAVFLPMVYRADLSIVQDVFTDILGKRNTLQLRADFLNVGNLINKSWGLGQTFVTTQPLIPTAARVDGQGKAQYTLRVLNNQLITQSLQQTAGIFDVFRIQFSLRYMFN